MQTGSHVQSMLAARQLSTSNFASTLSYSQFSSGYTDINRPPISTRASAKTSLALLPHSTLTSEQPISAPHEHVPTPLVHAPPTPISFLSTSTPRIYPINGANLGLTVRIAVTMVILALALRWYSTRRLRGAVLSAHNSESFAG